MSDKFRVFYLPESVSYVSFLSPAGIPVVFYQGYLKLPENAPKEVLDFVPTIKDVKELKGNDIPKDIPAPPARSRSRSWATATNLPNPTTVTPAELLQRAVASSASTPQAAQSNSPASTK